MEVDTETGIVRLTRLVSADDVGQAINPQAVDGQIEGAIAQAQGYALMENFQILPPFTTPLASGWTRSRSRWIACSRHCIEPGLDSITLLKTLPSIPIAQVTDA